MADSSIADHLWAVVVIGGFVVLGAAIAYAMIRNKVAPEQHAHSEAATKQMYDDQAAADRTPR